MTPLKRGPLGYRVGAGADARPVGGCWLCSVVGQYLLNWALLLDFALNTILAGDPNMTVSQRAARARLAGSRPAAAFCAALTFVWRLFGAEDDHCQWSLSEGSIGREIWSWADVPPANPPAPPQER